MNINVTRTEELFDIELNGLRVPVRVWRGVTASGIPVEAMIAAIVPLYPESNEAFAAECSASGMVLAREQYEFNTGDVKTGVASR